MSERGFTLVEIIVSAVLAAMMTAGIMTTYLTALMISRNAVTMGTAAPYVQQTLERFRNNIACDHAWFDPATCLSDDIFLPPGWVADPLPVGSGLPGGVRDYRVAARDCDGNAIAGDCLQLVARVQWTPAN